MSTPWPVFRFAEIDSTNTEAKRRAAAGSFENQWIVADRQSAGRGRQDRSWVSPVGNIFATALFHEPGGISAALRVPFAAALAVVDTVLVFAPGSDVRVKWPNDVRIARRKVSGILVETGAHGADLWIAAGIGLNVASAPDGLGQASVCLDALAGQTVPLRVVLRTLQGHFGTRLEQARTDFTKLRQDWLRHAEGLGETVSVRAGDDIVEGIFAGLEPDGALCLRLPDGSARIIRAGEVNLIGRT